jgi:hypothetical protein
MRCHRIVVDAPPMAFKVGDLIDWPNSNYMPKGRYKITDIEYIGVNQQGQKIDKHTLEAT